MKEVEVSSSSPFMRRRRKLWLCLREMTDASTVFNPLHTDLQHHLSLHLVKEMHIVHGRQKQDVGVLNPLHTDLQHHLSLHLVKEMHIVHGRQKQDVGVLKHTFEEGSEELSP